MKKGRILRYSAFRFLGMNYFIDRVEFKVYQRQKATHSLQRVGSEAGSPKGDTAKMKISQISTSSLREGMAVIGSCLFVFGVWQVYHPAAYILSGIILAAPFIVGLRRAK